MAEEWDYEADRRKRERAAQRQVYKAQKINDATVIVRREFTWPEFCDAVEANLPSLPERHVEGSAWHWGTDGPLGPTGHVTETLSLARGEGWQASIPTARDLLTHIEMDMGEAMHTSFAATYDVAGAEVDMGRFMGGEPECMVESMPIKVMRTGRVVKLAVPICYQSGTHADLVKARGAAVMALVDAFVANQHPVEIWAVMAIMGRAYGQKKDRRLVYTIKVQDSDAPLNMGRIMYALAHPTMLRQLCFAVEHGEDDEARSTFSIGSGYGSPEYGCVIDDLNINVENAIILPGLEPGDDWSEEASVRWIREQLTMISEGAV